jgi:hypothetical protein
MVPNGAIRPRCWAKDGQSQENQVTRHPNRDCPPGLVAVLDGFIQQPVSGPAKRAEISVLAQVRAPRDGYSPCLGILARVRYTDASCSYGCAAKGAAISLAFGRYWLRIQASRCMIVAGSAPPNLP